MPVAACASPAVMPCLANGDFEDGFDHNPPSEHGWPTTVTVGDSASIYIGYNASLAHAGHSRLAMYNANAYSGYSQQTITNLPNGTYTLSAWFVSDDATGIPTLDLYATDYNAASLTDKLTTDIAPRPGFTAYVQFSVTDIVVTSNKLTIGVNVAANANKSVNVDDVTLVRTK
jgi:arabinogalactan endo-1,4-beta-galactosidase